MRCLRDRFLDFWTSPADPLPLAVLRIGLVAVLLGQAYVLAPDYWDLYSRHGILQGALGVFVRSSELPNISDAIYWLGKLGLQEDGILRVAAAGYVASLLCLLLGYHTRRAALATWLGHLLLSGGHITSYGVDTFAGIMLFYLLWIPSGDALSLDRAAGRTDGRASVGARIGLRLVQLHLCIAYFYCGFDKALGEQWWSGEAIWRSTMIPLYAQFDMQWLSRVPMLAKLSGWGTLVVECGYPVAMWIPRVRPFALAAIVSLHLGIWLLMGLTLFAALMIVLSVSAFGVPMVLEKLGGAVAGRGGYAQDSVLRRRVWSV